VNNAPRVPRIVPATGGAHVTAEYAVLEGVFAIRRLPTLLVGNGVQVDLAEYTGLAVAIGMGPAHTHDGHIAVVVLPPGVGKQGVVVDAGVRVMVADALVEFQQQEIVLKLVVVLANPQRVSGLGDHVVKARINGTVVPIPILVVGKVVAPHGGGQMMVFAVARREHNVGSNQGAPTVMVQGGKVGIATLRCHFSVDN